MRSSSSSFSYLLLMSVAFELTQALNHISDPAAILPPALLIAFTTSVGSFFICLITYKLIDRQSIQGKISLHLFINALKNIAKAFLALGLGILLGILVTQSNLQIAFNFEIQLPSSHYFPTNSDKKL